MNNVPLHHQSSSASDSADVVSRPKCSPQYARLIRQMPFILDTIDENDLPRPDDDKVLVILAGALRDRASIMKKSSHTRWTRPRREALLRHLLIVAIEPVSLRVAL